MNDINQISIEKIKRWFEKISRGKASYGKEGIKPANDWGVLIIVATIVFCLEGALAWFIYFQIENGVWFNQPTDSVITNVSLDQNLLQKITGQIDAKSATSSAPTNQINDPSL